MRKVLYPLCIVMAVLIVAISLVTATFSWFEPGVKQGVGLQFKETTSIRAQDCTFETFRGTLNSDPTNTTGVYGLVTYSSDAMSDLAVTAQEGETLYFKTLITNGSFDYDTNVSLFLSQIIITNGSASVGVAVPTNTYRTYTTTQSDMPVIRNANVSYQVENEANKGQLSVEWFVKCESGTVSLNPANLYLSYN